MAKIRIGTDILFRVKISSDYTFPHVFDKAIQQVIPLLISTRHQCAGSELSPTSTGQCLGGNLIRATHMLRQHLVQITGERELMIEVLFLGEEQRRRGVMDLQLTWVEGDLGSERDEQRRFTIDIPMAVTMVNHTDIQDLTNVYNEDGRLVIDLDWEFSTEV